MLVQVTGDNWSLDTNKYFCCHLYVGILVKNELKISVGRWLWSRNEERIFCGSITVLRFSSKVLRTCRPLKASHNNLFVVPASFLILNSISTGLAMSLLWLLHQLVHFGIPWPLKETETVIFFIIYILWRIFKYVFSSFNTVLYKDI